ncbi:predicted protein [Sclerotinia sclerotiorum 1980 UF-70]|uniref:Uncharacterized protein n=1 Tax=Sclerotinia sclerotiorum (strain ATCC 18683 / 1980 / Ss-1) TaxID=665079 RepID=A7EAA9_SCLS1|nr:predicted protein [Sclerotinia sclerotiorum 1980 UF-70]EDN99387.1 predicted protein [Sclerotinia sclerotiorum 1980 UF-70]
MEKELKEEMEMKKNDKLKEIKELWDKLDGVTESAIKKD